MRFISRHLTSLSGKPALAALLLTTALPAQAETLTLLSVDGVSTHIGYANNTVLQINHIGTPGNSLTPGIVGTLGIRVNDEYLQSFCLEPAQLIELNISYEYNPVPVDAAYDPATARDIGRLLTRYGALPLTCLQSAAMQISLWEITGDEGPHDLASGNFSITGSGVSQPKGFTDLDAIDLANSWLTNLGDDNNVSVTVHQNKYAQDLVSWSWPVTRSHPPVPVPDGGSTLALGGISLLGLAGAGSIFRNRQKAPSCPPVE